MRTILLRLTILTLLTGCGDIAAPPPKAQPAAPPVVNRGPKPAKPAVATNDLPASKQPVPSTKLPGEFQIGRAEADAVKKIATVIDQSLELGPTLVVWVFDRTESAADLVQNIAGAALQYYQTPETQASLSGKGQLLTAIAAFDEQADFPLDPPSAELAKIQTALESLAPGKSARERPFGAVKQALDKYLPLRTREQREVIVVVVTDEAGEDGNLVDELIDVTRRQAIGVYAIGLPAPWGQMNPHASEPKSADLADETTPIVGPESLLSERVDLSWTSHYVSDAVDSGFGPFALERLCRGSRGHFIALRGLASGSGSRGVSARSWPNGGELQFQPQVVQKYAPNYVSQAEYQRLLAENKACAALVDAAKMPKVVIEGTPGRNFPKDAEAKMARQLSSAQQFAASNSPRVDRLYEALARGEPDRGKLAGPRWQAEFDLAYGRVLANKARLDGYNSMIAALKRGKNFQKPESKAWILEPADHFETESTIQRMADKAKTYLQRVIQEHPGTPWAQIAEEELKLPLGWSWSEI